MKNRIVFIFIFFTVIWSIMLLRAFTLQLLPHQRLSELQSKQFTTNVTLRSTRGSILDREGKELAVSVASYSLYADPKMVENKDQASRQLAQVLGASKRSIYLKLKNKKKRFVWIKRQLPVSLKDEVVALNIQGLGFVEEPKRIYPNNNLLSQVIGFVGREGLGLEGIELGFDKKLKGQEKKIKIQRDARGRPLIMDSEMFQPPSDGEDIQLTIDSDLQYMLEKELANALMQFQADSAVGVVLDAQTSEVLAMANVPTFNINTPFQYSPEYRKNRVVTDFFEPGSTMKTFVIAAALEEGLVQPNTKINCEGGSLKIGKYTITEAEASHSFDELTVSEVLAHSSNIGVAKLAFQLGDQKLRTYFNKYGFGEKLNFDFPGTASGLIRPLPWPKITLATTAFGHGIAATPLQIAAAYTAIANGGVLKTPQIIKLKNTSDNNLNPRPLFTKETTDKLKFMLTAATAKGSTGEAARVPGFQVAGKTGTAQKVDLQNGGYVKNAYISSFSGFVPSHDPKFVIYIAVDNPQKQYYGSQVAAPLFSKVAGYALRKAGVEPILLANNNVIDTINPFAKPKTKPESKNLSDLMQKELLVMPDLNGLTLREVLNVFREKNYKVQIKGRGVVIDSTPKPGEPLEREGKIQFELESKL